MKTLHYRGWTTTLKLGKKYTAIEFPNHPKYNHRVLGINLVSIEQHVKHYIDERSCRVQPGTGNVIAAEPAPIRKLKQVSVPVPPEHFQIGDRVRVIDSWLKEDIGRLGTIHEHPGLKELREHQKVLLDGDCLCRHIQIQGLEKVTPGQSQQSPPEHFSEKSVQLHDQLAILEIQRDQIRAEGPVAPKGAWIEKYTAKRKRKKSAPKVYIYYRLRNGTDAKHQSLGKAGSLKYNQMKDAITRRNELERVERQIRVVERQLED